MSKRKTEEMHSEPKRQKVEEPPPLQVNFPTPFIYGDYGSGRQPYTQLELTMMAASGAIRSKPNWWEKIHNPEITAKWRKEVQHRLRSEDFDYVLKELEWYASLRDGPIELSAVDGIWQADGHIPQDVKSALVQGVAKLENVPEESKDWHPGSNNQVLDLVHPSLYCFVDNVSQTTEEPCEGSPLISIGTGAPKPMDVPAPTRYRSTDYSLSKKFQWLPAEFHVDTNGKVKITSYINNLHPVWNRELYGPIARIFERFVPLFNRVLTNLANPRPLRITPGYWYEEEEFNEDEEEEEEDEDDDFDEFEKRKFIPPAAPSEFTPPPPPPPQKTIDLCGRKLQVIVKLANIILTPENPTYPGGVWHVEGMKNEQIVASGIYYYTSENISESLLAFRTAVCEPDYEQNDNRGVSLVYGLANEAPLNQELGAVETKEDRCIVFPNIYQHQVQPFELADKSKPGYRKILVFFLVDPTKRVLSTARVPPQQQSWYKARLQTLGVFPSLPEEVIDNIMSFMHCPMSLEQAKAYREELMHERKFFVKENTREVYERAFSLCEH